MHTSMYAKASDGHDYFIIHNGDWSGLTKIVRVVDDDDRELDEVYEIPSELMVYCVGEMVRSFRIERLENLDSHMLVGLP
jgi:hypothetical protein